MEQVLEKNQEKKHVCKWCNKSFFSGKILGGHMRLHIAENSIKEEAKFESSNNMSSEGYGLRENPKKSWRFSGLKNNNDVDDDPVQESAKCRLCGREFESPKSLHGHMKHHSMPERKRVQCQECGKRFRSVRSLTGHMRLHSRKLRVSRPDLVLMETVNLVRRKRSIRMRYKITPYCSFPSWNESLSSSEIDEEVEEVAKCLMMLSRGVHNWGGFNSVSFSNVDHLLSFETKSIDENKQSEDGDYFSDDNGLTKMKKPREENLDSCISGREDKMFECDSEMVCSDEKKIGMEILITDVDSQRPKLGDESGLEVCNMEIEQGNHAERNGDPSEGKLSQDLMEEVGLDLDQTVPEFEKSVTSNMARLDGYVAELSKEPCNNMMFSNSDSNIVDDSLKKSEFRCRTCNKVFPTYQSLGGHQTSHRMTRSNISLKTDYCQEDTLTKFSPEIEPASKLECTENSADMEMDEVIDSGHESKKNKEHRCAVCFKSFVSGQALGGHKRAHLSKGKEEQTMVIKPEVSDIRDVFNINLPDMADAGGNCDVIFNKFWAQSSFNHEPLVGLIAN